MNSRKNALVAAKGRESMARTVVIRGSSVATVVRLYRTTPKTVSKMGGALARGPDGPARLLVFPSRGANFAARSKWRPSAGSTRFA
jgi:hypothetical protein